MNKVISFFTLATASLFFLQSCSKMHHEKSVTTTQTVNATLNENSSYTYTLPAASTGSTTVITTNAVHSSVSALATDANGNTVYNYTPATDYVGNDAVVITTTSEEQHCGGHHGCPGPGGPGGSIGNCGNHSHHDDDDNKTITTINLTVASGAK